MNETGTKQTTEIEWEKEQARRMRNNKIAAMLETYGLDEHDLAEWIKEHADAD